MINLYLTPNQWIFADLRVSQAKVARMAKMAKMARMDILQ
jgi:hypothetical protein